MSAKQSETIGHHQAKSKDRPSVEGLALPMPLPINRNFPGGKEPACLALGLLGRPWGDFFAAKQGETPSLVP